MARKSALPPRRAWEDRYRTPNPEDLIRGMEGPGRELFLHVRGELAALAGVRESLSWQGIPWRWSFSYRMAGGREAFAFLVPQPGRPLLGLPLGECVFDTVLESKISKPVREAILHAPAIGSVRWTQWELTSRTQAEDLLILARCAHGAGAAGERAQQVG
jgi:hypothetical protein